MNHEEKGALEKLSDPGIPEHLHRKTDVDPRAAKKAERQVALLFTFSAIGTILFIYSYIWIPEDTFVFLPITGTTNAHQLFLGIGLAMALFFIGMGAVHWAKTLMPDHEVVDYRKEQRSKEEDRAAFVATVKDGAAQAGLGRRPLIKRAMGLALGLVGLSPLLLLRDLGPLPENELN
jgi:ubiquinol-cytochrome c reductase iron-sulfur subunit